MSISPTDVQNVALKEDDFGHEMRVGKVISNVSNIQVQHGGTYVDVISNKPRQFDFRCSLRKSSAEIHLSVECKNLNTAAPLAVCGTKRRQNESFHDIIESRLGSASPGKKNVIFVDGASSATFRAGREDSFYLPNRFVGKSLLRMKPASNPSSGGILVSVPDSDVYEKWAQALSSSVDLAEIGCRSAETHQAPKFYTVVLPIVVVPDESLWSVEYDDGGAICIPPTQVDECEFFVGREIKVTKEWFPHHFTLSHIHFFTISGFASFLARVATDEVWDRLFTSRAQELL